MALTTALPVLAVPVEDGVGIGNGLVIFLVLSGSNSSVSHDPLDGIVIDILGNGHNSITNGGVKAEVPGDRNNN